MRALPSSGPPSEQEDGQDQQPEAAGRRRLADVRVLAEERDVVDAYGVMASDNHQFARFNKIGFDLAGNPVPGDLHLAWAAGARAFRLTPR